MLSHRDVALHLNATGLRLLGSLYIATSWTGLIETRDPRGGRGRRGSGRPDVAPARARDRLSSPPAQRTRCTAGPQPGRVQVQGDVPVAEHEPHLDAGIGEAVRAILTTCGRCPAATARR